MMTSFDLVIEVLLISSDNDEFIDLFLNPLKSFDLVIEVLLISS